jgi:ribonuclease T
MALKENYIIVDIETSGPNPSSYALLSIGACTLRVPRKKFYVELQPDKVSYADEALKISQLSLQNLKSQGLPALQAMEKFADWVMEVTPRGVHPVFTAYNAPFDWMFINDYFHRYLGHNPFGHNALDIKAFYMGWSGVSWVDTSFERVNQYFGESRNLSHHALDDAIDAAEIFVNMLDYPK